MTKTRFLFLLFVGVFLLGVTVQHGYGQAKEPDTVTLKGGPLGAVKFEHKLHVSRGAKCETCHHASKPQKPLTTANQACGTCHTTPPTAPMKTNKMMAFHNATSMAGTCVDCHKAELAKGNKKVPAKCIDCHKKA